tara:strand:+ start:3486 stop:3737 length:252 start_codon:yes stop_codon:yes gene_type:complete
MNWFLYVVKTPFIDEDIIFKPGENGVGQCSMAPGIMEVPYGVMYVIPEAYVIKFHKQQGQRRPCATIVEEAVEAYFGVRIRNR